MSVFQERSMLPKYWKLAEHLRRQIRRGELKPGDRLPSLAELQTEHGLSLGTVQKVHALLGQEGLIVCEQGRGTFVAQPAQLRATRTLGLVLHQRDSLANFYMMDLLAGVRREAFRRGLELRWLNDEEVTGGSKADAILFYCHHTEALAFNLPPEVPHALLFQHSPDFTCVVADDFTGTKLATQHLLDLGHRRIACLPSSDSDFISRQRLAGYQAALQEANMQPEGKWVKCLRNSRHYRYRKSGEVTMQNWLEQDWRELGCTAILAHNDETAIGVIKVLREQGLRVPDDVSVVGFDGTELSELSTPPLTTVKVPLLEIGAAVVGVLAEQIEKGVFDEPQKIVLPVRLKVGESTAAIEARRGQFVSLPN